MSIYYEIANRVNEKRLFSLTPALPGAPMVRHIYASSEIHRLITGPWVNTTWEERCGYLRGDLDRFIEGRVIAIATRPYKGKTAYMLRLHPPREQVWEIRSRDPYPGIRVFGRFADIDIFIALTWAKRADLAGPHSREWRDAREACKTEWRNLFPAYEPITGNGGDFRDYISANTVLI